jgi:hypothetical protein
MFIALNARQDLPSRHVAPRAPVLEVHGPGSAGRGAVEAFISRIYAQRFGADLRSFAPMLVSLRDDGGLVAAAGYRPAAQGALFLERYLDAPVHTLLGAQDGVARERIVEVGHLVGDQSGAGRRLITLMGPHLAAQGFEWVVSTLTEELRHLFVRIGVTPLALGRADPAVLGDEAALWGSYYEHHPVVLAGHLPHALRQMVRSRAVAKAAA